LGVKTGLVAERRAAGGCPSACAEAIADAEVGAGIEGAAPIAPSGAIGPVGGAGAAPEGRAVLANACGW
jgi:hypothetical protein